MKQLRFLVLVLMLLVSVSTLTAQDNQDSNEESGDCPSLVNQALNAADQLCEDTGRNQVCYGNVDLTATPQETVQNFSFEQVGDITDVTDLASLRLSPMDEEAGEWGIALMRLQANIPDTLPGQNVTFVLFGNVQLVNQVSEEDVQEGKFRPMQSFYLTTGIGDARCREAPDSGMLVQTPKGVGEVNFVINEVEVQMGSTVLFQAENDQNLKVSALEGAASVNSQQQGAYPVVAGTRFNLNIQRAGRRIIPIPELPEPYELERMQALPIGMLERSIEIRQPLSKTELNTLYERLETGEPPCGEAPFPPCDNLPAEAGGNPCVLPNADGERPEGVSPDRPLCEVGEQLAPEVTPESTPEPDADSGA